MSRAGRKNKSSWSSLVKTQGQELKRQLRSMCRDAENNTNLSTGAGSKNGFSRTVWLPCQSFVPRLATCMSQDKTRDH